MKPKEVGFVFTINSQNTNVLPTAFHSFSQTGFEQKKLKFKACKVRDVFFSKLLAKYTLL